MDSSDSSGTDDDLNAMQQNRFAMMGRNSTTERSVAINALVSEMNNDMKNHIHQAEQEAYTSVLRAFKAQSDAISWDKESLITELRKELRISDEENRKLLSKVNAEALIGRIREWRKGGRPKRGHDSLHEPMFTAPVKKQKMSESVASLSGGALSPLLDPPFQPSTTSQKRGHGFDSVEKKETLISPEHSAMKTSVARAAAAKGAIKGQINKDFSSSKNRIGKKVLADIEILQTSALINQADKIFNAKRLDPLEVEKARKLLKEHEQALMDAIAMLEGASDSESGINLSTIKH